MSWLAPFDALVSAWPAGWGGKVLRLIAWKRRFGACGRVHFGDGLVISGFDGISIGDNTSFMSRSYLYANDSGKLTIGRNCSFNHNVVLGAASGTIILGNDVLVGPNVVLRAADHEFGDCDRLIRTQGHRRGTIVIGNDVWLGANVVVTSGARVGDGCVVGAGSVVTGDLPAMSDRMGSPARPVHSRTREG